MPAITNRKFVYSSGESILHRNISQYFKESDMSAAIITQAQDKGLRHHVDALIATVRDFAAQLFAAHGGWLAAAQNNHGDDNLQSLAEQARAHSPSLADELRNFASRG
jgi:hypothetical protein